ncbi:SprT family zinc-dependent metalloprotease [Desulfobacterales bacterium HSG16]|nr:SprT family zinc-dependent metalloprotease [Desulfobacterales bacterium HSG16]
MPRMEISDITIDIVRKDIKNMHLAVYPPDGRVRIAVPLRINDEAVRLFAITKLSWIKKQRRRFEEQEREARREYIARESHYLFGQRFLLNVIEHNAPPKVEIKNKAKIDLYIRPDTPTEKRQKIMKEWYRSAIKEQIPPILKKYEWKTGVKSNFWAVKQMKTKWGSCNIEDRRIWINLELAKKPLVCLEYIILHELIHLIERHHNDNFQALMAKDMPQWEFYKEELNRLPVSHGDWEY